MELGLKYEPGGLMGKTMREEMVVMVMCIFRELFSHSRT